MRMALQTSANHPTDEDEFYDAVSHAAPDVRHSPYDVAARCEHDDNRRECAICALNCNLLVESDPVAIDQTEQPPLSPSPTSNLAPTLSTASADPVVTLFGHNAAAFGCTLCPFSAHQMADLHQHRRSYHRGVTFVDDFHADCNCDAVFPARSAATLHALVCRGEQRRRPTTRVAAAHSSRNSASGAGAPSPTPALDEPPALAPAAEPFGAPVSPPPRSSLVGGKRRRLNATADSDTTVDSTSNSATDPTQPMLPPGPRSVPSSAARMARRRLSTRWGKRVVPLGVPADPPEVIPDTPEEGWVLVCSRPAPLPPMTTEPTRPPPPATAPEPTRPPPPATAPEPTRPPPSATTTETTRPSLPVKPTESTRPPPAMPPVTTRPPSCTRWGPPRPPPVIVPDTPLDGWVMADGFPQPTSGSHADTAAEPPTATSPSSQATSSKPPDSIAASTGHRMTPLTTTPVLPVEPTSVTWRDLASIVSGTATTDAIVSRAEGDHSSASGDHQSCNATPMDVDAIGPSIMASTATSSSDDQGPGRRRRTRQHDRTPAQPAAQREHPDNNAEWLLRFDGACRGNPGPGGAGAALFDPSGTIVWSCAQYLPGNRTNNFAEYAGLLVGVSSAVHHGVSHLRIEGDSTLVIEQVAGRWQCRGKSLLRMRRQVRSQLARLTHHTLTHIDRVANHVTDNLANAALNRKGTRTECSMHPRSDTPACWTPGSAAARPSEDTVEATPMAQRREVPRSAEEEADLARRDGGEVFPVFDLNSGAVPARRPILRLRQLGKAEMENAEAVVEAAASALAVKLSDTDDWDVGEGYLTAMSTQLYETLLLFSDQAAVSSAPDADRHIQRSPRSHATNSRRRLEEALRRLQEQQRGAPDDRAAIKRARRKVGRIRTAIRRQEVRGQFRMREKACVEEILRSAEVSGSSRQSTSGEPAASTATPAPTGSSKCPIPRADLEAHFIGNNTERSRFVAGAPIGRAFRAALEALPPATHANEVFTSAITLDEVEAQLHHVNAASAPGLDGIGYAIYKRFAPQLLPLLHTAFNFCWKHGRVPRCWKMGVVRLLPKKGDPMHPGNWRPICLQQAVYKLYAGIIAKRFTSWMEVNGRHTDAQKGFRAFNGCAEHNFIASTMSDQSKRQNRALYIVWYDLANAFGSVPHEMMWFVLQELGVPPSFITLCKDLYMDAAFMISNAKDGCTSPIRQRVGVFQGCPLSPHLFTATLIPLLRALQQLPDVGVKLSSEDRPSVTAYADDLKVFSTTKAAIQRQHDLMQRFLKWSGMRANAGKCAAMGVAPNAHRILQRDDLKLAIHGDAIPSLSMGASYSYLGIGDGLNHEHRRLEMAPLLAQIKRQATALFQSGLAPWQVLKAYKVYLLPRLEYGLRFLRPLSSQLISLDEHIQRGFQHLLRLPDQATHEMLYAPTSCGGLGLLPLGELWAAIQISYGWQLLHCRDEEVQRIARAQLGQVVRKRHNVDERYWRGKEDVLLELFLNNKLRNSYHAPKKRHHADIDSLWSDIQGHLSTYKLVFETVPEAATSTSAEPRSPAPHGALHLRVPHFQQWLDRKTVLRHVKLYLKLRHKAVWESKEAQGRTVCAHGGRGSSFVTNPRGLWEADYTFVMKARLDEVDTNAVLKRKHLRAHPTCRYPGCSHVETLPHVLQKCPGTEEVIRTRHDNALRLITRELEARVKGSNGRLQLRVDRTVPGFEGPALRPDLQLYDKEARTAAIVDLAIPFDAKAEGRGSGLTEAHDKKIRKYKVIERHLTERGWQVKSGAIVYGALGSVAASNQHTYTDTLGLLKRTGRKLDQQVSAAAIQGSRRIWRWHAAQHVRRQRCRREVTRTGGDSPPTQQHPRRPRQL